MFSGLCEEEHQLEAVHLHDIWASELCWMPSAMHLSFYLTHTWVIGSLVPRPFPPPVFDRLQYKNGGEGLGERVMCVTSGRREGRRAGGGARSL